VSAVSDKAPLAAYLVRGDDPALRAEAARALIKELVGDGDAGLMVEEHEPDGEAPDTSPIADAASTPPFLTDRRIVVGRDIGAYSSEALVPLLRYLEDPLPSTSVVLVTGDKGRLSDKVTKAVKAVGHVVDAGVPRQARQRSTWLAEHVRSGPVRLEPAALNLVEKHLGEDLGRLTNLLEALGAAYGHGARVGPEEVEPFLGEAGSVPPWELTDAIDAGETDRAVAALHRMTNAGDRHPLQTMAVLANHYARLLRLDGAGITDEAAAAAALGIKGSTFPAAKALRATRKLGHDGVVQAMALLAEADLDLRGAREWPDSLVLEVLVARLSRLSRASARR
jgi:DNA polymerase-3 subunit delta